MKRIVIPVLLLVAAGIFFLTRGIVAERDKSAVAVLVPTEGNETSGTVFFTEVSGGLRVNAEIYGLNPGQLHGFHIHEYGDMRSPDGTGAGGHYDPEETGYHGIPGETDRPHHAGDMGNLVADENGTALYDRVISGLSVEGENPVLGRAVIVHAEPDDGDQPLGDAGARIAIGVIGVAGNTP